VIVPFKYRTVAGGKRKSKTDDLPYKNSDAFMKDSKLVVNIRFSQSPGEDVVEGAEPQWKKLRRP
jgi:hypothetical protein